MNIQRLNSTDADFWSKLDQRLAWDSASDQAIFETVNNILSKVKEKGDAAVVEYTNTFDRMSVESISELEIPLSRLQQALESISPDHKKALEQAAARIKSYAKHQQMDSWSYTEDDGTVLGQQVTALDRVGLYVPGGKAAYPSSVLMNAIPAKVAGVLELIMVVPTPDGEMNDLVLAAAAISGVDKVFSIGGGR